MIYFALAGVFLGLFAVNINRLKRNINFELRPNCLMTRHPLVFIPGRFSFFYFSKYWNNIPQYLKEHGYEVIEAKLSFKSLFFHKKSLVESLKSLSLKHKKFHVIFDPSQISQANHLAKTKPPYIHAIHIFSSGKDQILAHNEINQHQIDLSGKVTHNKEDYLKILHDLLTQSPKIVPSELLGAQSHEDQLTVEPKYLEEIVKIAENDWH